MDLRRLDAIVQFLSATNTQLENWDTAIPYNVLMYCPETRQIKLGENKKWVDTPVFIDFNVLDNINLLAQNILPEVNDLNEYAVTSSVAITSNQQRILQLLSYFDTFKEEFNIELDPNDPNVITNIGLVDRIDSLENNLNSLQNSNTAEHSVFDSRITNLEIRVSALENS